MKLTTIALATAFTLTSTFALAQAPGLSGYGSVVAPSVGSYAAPSVGSSNEIPTWSTTGPAATTTMTSPYTFRNFSGNALAPRMGDPSGSTLAPSRRMG
jgi:hypothetical protein